MGLLLESPMLYLLHSIYITEMMKYSLEPEGNLKNRTAKYNSFRFSMHRQCIVELINNKSRMQVRNYIHTRLQYSKSSRKKKIRRPCNYTHIIKAVKSRLAASNVTHHRHLSRVLCAASAASRIRYPAGGSLACHLPPLLYINLYVLHTRLLRLEEL